MMLAQSELIETFVYIPETGKLYWKERPRNKCANEQAWRSWNTRFAYREAFTALDKKGYKVGAIYNKLYKAHRIIWVMIYGYEPDQIDHDDGNKSNNRLTNLRDVSNSENHKNMGIQKSNSSGIVGVNWSEKQNKWRCRIHVDGSEINLGHYAEFAEAVKIRKLAEIEHGFHLNHGDKVRNGSKA